MNINISRGLKRIYLIISIIWFSLISLNSIDTIKPKTYTENIALGLSCNEVQKLNKDSLMSGGSLRAYEAASKEKNFIEFYSIDNQCLAIYEMPFFQRLANKNFISFIIFSLIPIPLYMLIIFIINGFRKS